MRLRDEILNGMWSFYEDSAPRTVTCSICSDEISEGSKCHFGHRNDMSVSGCLLCEECMAYFSLSHHVITSINIKEYLDQATAEYQKTLDEFKKKIGGL